MFTGDGQCFVLSNAFVDRNVVSCRSPNTIASGHVVAMLCDPNILIIYIDEKARSILAIFLAGLLDQHSYIKVENFGYYQTLLRLGQHTFRDLLIQYSIVF